MINTVNLGWMLGECLRLRLCQPVRHQSNLLEKYTFHICFEHIFILYKKNMWKVILSVNLFVLCTSYSIVTMAHSINQLKCIAPVIIYIDSRIFLWMENLKSIQDNRIMVPVNAILTEMIWSPKFNLEAETTLCACYVHSKKFESRFTFT